MIESINSCCARNNLADHLIWYHIINEKISKFDVLHRHVSYDNKPYFCTFAFISFFPHGWLNLWTAYYVHGDLNLIIWNLSWWRHQIETFSVLLALCAGKSPVNGEFPHKGQWREALRFSLICAWTNGWVNNRYAGDLRRHRPHYNATVIMFESINCPNSFDANVCLFSAFYLLMSRHLICLDIGGHSDDKFHVLWVYRTCAWELWVNEG